jgi:hypothetical protein
MGREKEAGALIIIVRGYTMYACTYVCMYVSVLCTTGKSEMQIDAGISDVSHCHYLSFFQLQNYFSHFRSESGPRLEQKQRRHSTFS